MSAKYTFYLKGEDRRRPLPERVNIGRTDTETLTHVALKLLAYLLFYRDRLQIETSLHNDNIPFVPDLVELDFELRPKLWVECGECSVAKLDKLAVKVPEAEIWIVKRSPADARDLMAAMGKSRLRRDRYNLVGLDPSMIEELCGTIRPRNEVYWLRGAFEPPEMQLDVNGLWFDAPFELFRF